jgi:hypothetical protein
MSDAVLRARNQYVSTIPCYKVTLLPRHPSEAEFPSDYVNLVLEHKPPRQIQHVHLEQKGVSRKKHEWAWILAVSITVVIILVGLVIGYLKPGPITGAVLPIGVTLWWLLYKMADRFDQPA